MAVIKIPSIDTPQNREIIQDVSGAEFIDSATIDMIYDDVAGTIETMLKDTAVTPGAYTNTDLTVDAQGRITLAASGSAGVTDHGALTGLTPDDDHSHYALLAGRTGAGLQSTLILGSTVVDSISSLVLRNDAVNWNLYCLGNIADRFAIGTDTVTALQIATNGNIGFTYKVAVGGLDLINDDFTVGKNTAAADVRGSVYQFHATGGEASQLITNSNPSKPAYLYLNVSSAGVGDPFVVCTVGGGGSWSFGLDNSDSDKFKISGATILGTNDYLAITTAGLVGIGTSSPARLLDISKDGAGSDIAARIRNTDVGGAVLELVVDTANGTDCKIVFNNVPGNAWSLGLDNSDGDKFKISGSGALGTSDRVVIDSNGNMGLGTSDPGARVHTEQSGGVHFVAKTTHATNLVDFLTFLDSASTVVQRVRFDPTASTLFYRGPTSTFIQIHLGSGFVNVGGIVDYTPGEALDCAGNYGGTRAIRVYNTSDADSTRSAAVRIKVGGTSAGDPFLHMNVHGATDWSLGIDNSDSDSFKISASSALGTNDYLAITTAGAWAFSGDSFVFSPISNQHNQIQIDNQFVGKDSKLHLSVLGATGGDPFVLFNVPSGSQWSIGIDNSDSDKFKIMQGSALTTDAGFVMESNQKLIFGGLAQAVPDSTVMFYFTVASSTQASMLLENFQSGNNIHTDYRLKSTSHAGYLRLSQVNTTNANLVLLGSSNFLSICLASSSATVGAIATGGFDGHSARASILDLTKLGDEQNTNGDSPAEVILVGANQLGTAVRGNLGIQSNSAFAINFGGSLAFGGRITTASSVAKTFATISGRKESAVSAETAGYLAFATAADGMAPAERMRITSAGLVGIGGSPDAYAILDLQSTVGALLVPRMTSAQRDALTAQNGMILYNTTTAKFQGYEAGAWANLI